MKPKEKERVPGRALQEVVPWVNEHRKTQESFGEGKPSQRASPSNMAKSPEGKAYDCWHPLECCIYREGSSKSECSVV